MQSTLPSPRLLLAPLFLVFAACSASQSQGVYQQIAVYAGERELGDDEWDSLDKQPAVGIEYSRTNTAGLGFEIGLMGSHDDDEISGIDFEATVVEAYGGVRKDFPLGKLRPYLGAGLAVVVVDLDADFGPFDGDDADGSGGLYAHGGLLFDLTDTFFIGADVRVLTGTDFEVAGIDGDADYGQFTIVLGVSF